MSPAPRKPVQQRSRATVDAIVEAGFRCVARDGIANLTTRRIADTAGIGVGSLYEYFSNKEEILDAMNRRFVDDVVVLLRRVGPDIQVMDIEPAIHHLFDAFQVLLTANEGRYLTVARQVMQSDTVDYVEPVSRALQEVVLQYLMNHPTLLKPGDDAPALAYVIINAGIFVMLRHLSADNPPITYAQVKNAMVRLIAAGVSR